MAVDDGTPLDATEPNGWVLMHARKQIEEIERSVSIRDRVTAQSAADALHGLWLGAVAYESYRGPTPIALDALIKQSQRLLYGPIHTHDKGRPNG